MSDKPMKTIKQIADEIGVSKQAVYKRVKGSPHKVVAPYVHTLDGVMYILEQGEILIIEAFSKSDAYDGAHKEPHTKPHTEYTGSHTNNDEILFLREQNKMLFEQLSAKDGLLEIERIHSREQADKLSNLATQLAELTRNNQVLLGAEQSRTNPVLVMNNEMNKIESDEKNKVSKKGILQRLFKKL